MACSKRIHFHYDWKFTYGRELLEGVMWLHLNGFHSCSLSKYLHSVLGTMFHFNDEIWMKHVNMQIRHCYWEVMTQCGAAWQEYGYQQGMVCCIMVEGKKYQSKGWGFEQEITMLLGIQDVLFGEHSLSMNQQLYRQLDFKKYKASIWLLFPHHY